jgi:hypothetical protein
VFLAVTAFGGEFGPSVTEPLFDLWRPRAPERSVEAYTGQMVISERIPAGSSLCI